MSTSVNSDTGEVSISDTCQADSFYIISYLSEKRSLLRAPMDMSFFSPVHSITQCSIH